jgi:mannose-6-phosphate isomerase-like protein (cupin superfamily)
MVLPFSLNPGDGQQLDIFDLKLTMKASSAETSGMYSLFEGIWQPGGFGPLPHIHKSEDESFYVLEGQFDFHIGDETMRAEQGTFLMVPRGTLHSFTVAGESPARLLFLHSPPIEGFFQELAKLPEAGPPDPERVRALMRNWGMEAPTP